MSHSNKKILDKQMLQKVPKDCYPGANPKETSEVLDRSNLAILLKEFSQAKFFPKLI